MHESSFEKGMGKIMKHKNSFISIALAIIMIVSLCAVVGTTSVSAAGKGNPLPTGTGPSWCTLQGAKSQEMWLFVQGSDGALWYGIWYPMTTGWSQNGSPSAGH